MTVLWDAFWQEFCKAGGGRDSSIPGPISCWKWAEVASHQCSTLQFLMATMQTFALSPCQQHALISGTLLLFPLAVLVGHAWRQLVPGQRTFAAIALEECHEGEVAVVYNEEEAIYEPEGVGGGRGKASAHMAVLCWLHLLLGSAWLCVLLHLFFIGNRSRWTDLPLHEVLFSAVQASAYLLTASHLVTEWRVGCEQHSLRVRLFWAVSFVGCTLCVSSGILRLRVGSPILSRPLFWDDLLSALSWGPLAYLGSVVVWPATGLKRRRGYPTDDGAAQLLSNDLSRGEGACPPVAVTQYVWSGPVDRALFMWLNPLLLKGREKQLALEDVPSLPRNERALCAYEAFHASWCALLAAATSSLPETRGSRDEQLLHPVDGSSVTEPLLNRSMVEVGDDTRKSSEKTPGLSTALAITFWKPFAYAGILVLVNTSVAYTGPLILHRFVEFTESREGRAEGFVLVSVLFVAKLIDVLTSHQYNFQLAVLSMRIRCALVAATYRKGLRLSSKAKKSHNMGEIVNYMAVDAQRIADLTLQLHSLWVLPTLIAIALVILFQVVGISMLAGVTAMLITMFGNLLISQKLRLFQMNIMTVKDKRMKATNEVLNNMKVVKLHAWEDHFRNAVEKLRMEEMGWLSKYMYTAAANIFLLWFTPLLVSVFTFGMMILMGAPLTTARVFTAIATFRILQEPLRSFPLVITAVTQAMVSFDRLQKFLISPELQPDAVARLPATSSPSGESDIDQTPTPAVSIHNATFTWDPDSSDRPTLNGITLQVKQGRLTAVVGAVGSGKSSLLSCILGEMTKLSGSVSVRGRVAYVAQSPWIQNASLRDNVLFGREYDSERYARTIEACALSKDLSLMPAGDKTEIGERGINLSGGQKQRVQLARAVYQDMDVYLLDDPFSAVDAHTGTDLFKKCIAGALKSKTVILVTHQVEFLLAADQIVVMRGGEIVQLGKYSDLLATGTDFSALVDAHNNAMEACNNSTDDELPPLPSPMDAEKSRPDEVDEDEPQPGGENGEGDRARQGTQLVGEEERLVGRVSSEVYYAYITKAFHGLHVPFLIITQVVWQFLLISSDWWLATATSEGTGANPVPRASPGRFMSVYAGLSLGSGLLVVVRSMAVALIGLVTTQAFFLDMLRAIFRAPMSFFDSTPSGRILNRASTDQSALDMSLPFMFGSTLAMLFQLIGILVVTSIVTWRIVLLIIPMSIIYFWVQDYYMASSRELTRLESVTKSPVINHFSESIAGASSIRAFDAAGRFAERNLRHVDENVRSLFHNSAASTWLGLRLEVIATLILCSAAFFLVLIPRDEAHPGLVGMSLSYGLSLNTAIFYTVLLFCALENSMVSVERVRQYASVPAEAPTVIEDARPPKEWPSQGAIDIHDLQVRYRPGTPLVLKGMTLSINGGEKIGVVGRTGSGKSSLVLTLFRVVEPCGGSICIDGIDITSIGLHDLRSRIGIIPQEPTLFEGTVRGNLDPLGAHSDVEIWEALEKCQLADVIREREEKLDTQVMENGENWSMGQRQLFCLGRALLSRARILVLDEATASVDAATDAVVQRTIRTEFGGSTVVSVAHRLPSVIDSDRVLVLEAGKVKEFDSPSVLMDDKSSLFSGLVQEYSSRSNSMLDLASADR